MAAERDLGGDGLPLMLLMQLNEPLKAEMIRKVLRSEQ
jgi:hypothetical protein